MVIILVLLEPFLLVENRHFEESWKNFVTMHNWCNNKKEDNCAYLQH
jgi:hypothetical protein